MPLEPASCPICVQRNSATPAVETEGTPRDGAWVTELTELIELDTWPEGTRAIARRERPHPGAQLTLFDQDEGFRHQLFITDQVCEQCGAAIGMKQPAT